MAGRLDLHHVCAEIGEHQRYVRSSVEMGEVEHPNVVERAN
jgi:hypothetical protein